MLELFNPHVDHMSNKHFMEISINHLLPLPLDYMNPAHTSSGVLSQLRHLMVYGNCS